MNEPKKNFEELVNEAEIVLAFLKSEAESTCFLGQQIVEVCRKKTPNQSAKRTTELCIKFGFHPRVSNLIIKSARFLAIIRRDFGMAQFNKVVESKL